MGLSVIGAGLGRTGTLSLKVALERLGFGPCYHMEDVFKNLDHVPTWDRAAEGKPVDWDTLFAEYRSAVDFPVASFYRELADRYPTAKVILTVRDPNRWYESVSETILQTLRQPLPDALADWGVMVRKAIVDRVFDGDIAEKDHLIECYERHNRVVTETIPPERLLVYEVSQGWEPLCRLLHVPVPSQEPFPRVNTTDEFRQLIAPMFQT